MPSFSFTSAILSPASSAYTSAFTSALPNAGVNFEGCLCEIIHYNFLIFMYYIFNFLFLWMKHLGDKCTWLGRALSLKGLKIFNPNLLCESGFYCRTWCVFNIGAYQEGIPYNNNTDPYCMNSVYTIPDCDYHIMVALGVSICLVQQVWWWGWSM